MQSGTAEALAAEFTTYLWDMPGYGASSKDPGHAVSLDVQGELLTDLLGRWDLRAPHVVAHDYGGAVALRARLLHGARFASLALADVVALAPWGSDFFRLVRDHHEVFIQLPATVHAAALRAYIASASYAGLTTDQVGNLADPWLRRGRPSGLLSPDRPGRPGLYRCRRAPLPQRRAPDPDRLG